VPNRWSSTARTKAPAAYLMITSTARCDTVRMFDVA
jgi:hypothetical protein